MSEKKSTEVRLSQVILFAGPATSLAVSPVTNYDPISVVKLVALCTIAFAGAGLLLSSPKNLNKIDKPLRMISGFFALFLFSSLAFSGAPINQQIFGAFGRSTGLLAYLSLLLLLIIASSLQDSRVYARVPKVLIGTTVPMLIYCFIQIAGLDPVKWSEFKAFGTLGNVNFLSAFLGLSATTGFVISLSKKLEKLWRFIALICSITSIPVILSTGSIQGFVILIAGLSFAFAALLIFYKRKFLLLLHLLINALGFFLVVNGLSNHGPLARFLFQPSVVFRGDYMHAGWEMTLARPFFGVGLDSYGDWYRELRGEISTLRTGPDRISNSAHNIFLDISSNGGFPLLIAYLGILAFAFYSAWKYLRMSTQIDYAFLALFSSWFAYQVQALVSINQLGVGVWGWLFTGVLIGYGKLTTQADPEVLVVRNRSHKRRKSGDNVLSAKSMLSMFLGGTLGFSLAFIPWKSDSAYKSALESRAIENMMKSVDSLGSSSFHSELVISAAMSINAVEQAKVTSLRLVEKYPRTFFGWKVIELLPNVTEQERLNAREKLRRLDPFNPQYTKS
jgi:O-antigen ligase